MASLDNPEIPERECVTPPQEESPHDDPELESDDEDEEDPLQRFAAVLAALNLDALPRLAVEARQKLHPGTQYENPTVGDPMSGSYHILYPLEFADGIRWLVKTPVNGVEGKWDELSAASLTSEANTMRLLKRETTVPVPEVFEFSATTNNKLNCPYIFMSSISGRPLQEVWHARNSGVTDPDILHAHRVRALEGIALAMVQLGKYNFGQGGCPLYDSKGNISGIGSMRSTDCQAELDRLFVDGDPCDDPIYVEKPVSLDTKEFYTFFMELHPSTHLVPRGLDILLRQLIDWLPKVPGPNPFVLAHPDFDIQNVLVSDDGQLQGIIDWDGVAAVPRSTGNECYPSWLTRDWDPMSYHYQEPTEDDEEPPINTEDSPENLKKYRQVYRECFKKAQEQGEGWLSSLWRRWSNILSSCVMSRNTGRLAGNDDITRQSLIADNLAIAAADVTCRAAILSTVVQKASAAMDLDEDDELSLLDLAEGLAEDELEESLLETLKCGFEKLLQMPL
ncbi:serine/threonine protein kinase [Ilyonectria robusta]